MSAERSSGLWRWGPTAVYLTVCAALVRWFWYRVNPDTLSYFSIAHHYLRGEWAEAANTGWSPMLSWLMLPLLAVRVPDLAAMHLIMIAAGAFTLYSVRKLAEDFELAPEWRQAVEYTAAGMTVAFALLYLEPDLLEAALFLMYARVVIRRSYGSPGSGIAAGALGAAAFLTKGYALYFFLGHFAFVNLLHGWRQREGSSGRPVLRQWVAGMVVFIALSAPWFAVMSYKAGHLTTGTTGAWNYRLVGPQAPVYPQYFGLLRPTGAHGSSMWEEPAPGLLPAWSPLASAKEMKHQLRLIVGNARTLIVMLQYSSLLSLAAVLGYAAWGLGRGSDARISWIYAVLTMAVYPAGYLLIVVEDRYLWSLFLLTLLMGAVAIQAAAKGLGRPGLWLLAGGYLLSFLFAPARMIVGQANDARWAPIAAHLHLQAPDISGKLAGCGGWNDGVQIAWALQMPFYGVTGPTSDELTVREQYNPDARGTEPPTVSTDQEIGQQLDDYKIDYFLALPSCKAPPAARIEQLAAEWQGARLYRLRHP
jgi:hypothetical protein